MFNLCYVIAVGKRIAKWNADRSMFQTGQAEEENFRNHETSFATGGLAFLPFILGCVGRGILGALDFGFSGTSTA